LAYRAIAQMGLPFILRNKNTFSGEVDPQYGTSVKEGFLYSNDELYRALNNMATHCDKMTHEDRITHMIYSVILLRCLQTSGYFGQKDLHMNYLTREEEFIGKLLFQFQIAIQVNTHETCEIKKLKFPIPIEEDIEKIGSAVYPTTLFKNHSCAPNTTQISHFSYKIHVANRSIKRNEEITESYHGQKAHFWNNTIDQRRKLLKTFYKFDCQCIGCRNNFPMKAQIPRELPLKGRMAQLLYLNNFEALVSQDEDEKKYKQAIKETQKYIQILEDIGVSYPHYDYEIMPLGLFACLKKMMVIHYEANSA